MNVTTDAKLGPLFAHDAPPRFDLITVEQVVPAISELIRRQDDSLRALETRATSVAADWDTLVRPLVELREPLSYAWNVVHHLLSVRNSPALRAAQESVQGLVIAAGMRLSQSEPLYRGLKKMRDGGEWSRLDQTQQRIIEAAIRDAEHSGIALAGAERERFNAIEMELAELVTRFDNHLLDATKAWSLTLTQPEEVAGLPPSLLAAAAQAARAAADAATAGNASEPANEAPARAAASPEHGPWRITLAATMAMPFLEHSRRRDLRERVYRAWVTRASRGEYDNQPLLERILRLRHQQAVLLGYESYAALSLNRKMAGTVASVEHLLAELRAVALPRARAELAELTAFARAESGDPKLELQHWDIGFWCERQREKLYAYNEEELRPYFPLPRVLDGLFALARTLFGVVITAADGAAPVWHDDVRFFRVHDTDGRELAAFYLDPNSRPENKRGGAWMNNCLDRKRRGDGSVRLPVAYLVCNQQPPVDAGPALMTFRDVQTLFHEFGHGLQHLLTTVDHPDAAGINNVEWDAVELPSQFMENWCYHQPTLLGFARHHHSGEPLPLPLFQRLLAARSFRAGSVFTRQVYFATLDLELHHRYDHDGGHDETVTDLVQRVASENTVLPPLAEDRFLCGFSHIFAGGYAAGYYSYKWAEVLSADAFAAFEEAGLDDPVAVSATGRRFRDTVLALGGSRHPSDVFQAFRGRPATTAALLRHNGLTTAAS